MQPRLSSKAFTYLMNLLRLVKPLESTFRRGADAQRWRHIGDSTLVRTASFAGKKVKIW
jgi:hypothetical protein